MRAAPDVLVALGRPKGHRGSYMTLMKTSLYHPDGLPFLTFGETMERAKEADAERCRAEEALRRIAALEARLRGG